MSLTIKEMWDRSEVDVNDCSNFEIIQHRFISQQTVECITATKDLILKDIATLNVADSLCTLLEDAVVTGVTERSYFICSKLNDQNVMIYVCPSHRDDQGPPSVEGEETHVGMKVNKVRVTVTAHREPIKKIFSYLSSTFIEAKVSVVKWWYKTEVGMASRDIYMEPVTTVLRPEFYPTIKNPGEYLKRYLDSDESVLLLAGPAGSGKTTLLRHFISEFNLNAEIIYDENIMNNDSLFQSFLFGRSHAMIIEDADHILASRDSDQNTLMARFLNISDGLIKLPQKKLIFTTNLSDFERIDSALLRAGRCFGKIHARELTYQEACIAAKAASIEPPKEEREYTLAELFNPHSGSKSRKAGYLT